MPHRRLPTMPLKPTYSIPNKEKNMPTRIHTHILPTLITLLAAIFFMSACANPQPTHFPIQIDGKYGFANQHGTITITPQFDQAFEFSEGLARVRLANKWGFINKSGEYVIKPQYAEVASFKDGLAAIMISERSGFIDKTGKLLINTQHNTELCPVEISGQWGVINRKGEFVVTPQHKPTGQQCDSLTSILNTEKPTALAPKNQSLVQQSPQNSTTISKTDWPS